MKKTPKSIARELRQTVKKLRPLLNQISESEAEMKSNPKKWSKKEILGHLIDSANNNQQKFVRLLLSGNPIIDFVGYAQDDWVVAQKYQLVSWKQLIQIWVYYNLHLAHVIEHADPEKLSNSIRIDGNEPAFHLDFIMADYVEHLKHHARAILPDAGIESNFTNVYNA